MAKICRLLSLALSGFVISMTGSCSRLLTNDKTSEYVLVSTSETAKGTIGFLLRHKDGAVTTHDPERIFIGGQYAWEIVSDDLHLSYVRDSGHGKVYSGSRIDRSRLRSIQLRIVGGCEKGAEYYKANIKSSGGDGAGFLVPVVDWADPAFGPFALAVYCDNWTDQKDITDHLGCKVRIIKCRGQQSPTGMIGCFPQ